MTFYEDNDDNYKANFDKNANYTRFLKAYGNTITTCVRMYETAFCYYVTCSNNSET
jgi:hypothetical protein